MKTLHELAIKLQESIIAQQEDAHNSVTLNITKYNNLKLKMDSRHAYPHVIIIIGISEAVFNIQDNTKTDGGLGPDEKYVKKWLGSSTVINDLKEIYIQMSELIRAEDEDKAIAQEGEAEEAKREPTRRKKRVFKNLLDMTIPTEGENLTPEEIASGESEENSEEEDLIEGIEEEEANRGKTSGDETVEEIKQDLKSYLKSMFGHNRK